MGELYAVCLRDELRPTEGDAVEVADIDTIEGIVPGESLYVVVQ